MNSVAGQILATALLLAVAVSVVVVVERVLARKRSSVETNGSSADAQGIRPANSGPMMVLITIAAGCAAAAAVVGFVGQDAQSERNASDDATVNRSTCLSTANADWRAAVGVLLIGYVAGDEQTTAFVQALTQDVDEDLEDLLAGAATNEEIQDRGVELLINAIANDARIGSETDPLCPFVAGSPSETPSEPDRSDIEVDGRSEPAISTTVPG